MINKARGEIEIELGGRKRILKPEFQYLLAAEDLIGRPLLQCYYEWGRGRISLREVNAIIWACLSWDKNLSGESLSFEEVGRMLAADGFLKFSSYTVRCVRSLFFPEREEQEAEAAKKKAEENANIPPQIPNASIGSNTSPLPS